MTTNMIIDINTHPNYKPSKKIRDALFDEAMKEHRKIMDRINARQRAK